MNSDNLPDCFDFEGHNPVVEYVVSIEGTKLNFENNLIDLSFTLKGEHTKEIIFTTKICIRCPVIY